MATRMRCRAARFGAGLMASALFMTSCGGGSSDGAVEEFDDDPGAAILDDFGVGSDEGGSDEGGSDDGGNDDEGNGDGSDGGGGDSAVAGSGTGAGSIVIGGVIYAFEADLCLETGTFLQISGSGLRADGVPFYGSISVSEDEDVNEDGTPDPSGTVDIEFGTDSPVESGPDDEASYEATLLVVGDQIDIRDFEYEIDDAGDITGSGTITDNNAVETDFGEYVDLIFSGGCS